MTTFTKLPGWLWALVVLSFCFLFFSLWYWNDVNSTIIQRIEFPTDVTITDGSGVGIGIRKAEMHFGIITPGHEARSSFSATNLVNESFRVLVFPRTNFSDWMSFSTTDFIIGPAENLTVSVNVTAPWDALPGHYNGTIVVMYMRPE